MTAETVLNAASKTTSVMSHSTSLINNICAHMLVPKHLFTGNYIYSTPLTLRSVVSFGEDIYILNQGYASQVTMQTLCLNDFFYYLCVCEKRERVEEEKERERDLTNITLKSSKRCADREYY